MGYCSQKPNVLLFLAAMEKILLEMGLHVPEGGGVAAAIRNYSQVESATASAR
jgi:aspartate aminotransferase-like enzyme